MQLAENILGELTLEEKVSLCHGSGTFTVGNLPRVGIEHEFTMVDNSSTVVGDVARMKWGPTEEGKKQTATAFPSLSAVGATWDRELARQFADALGKEARFRGKDMQLGPGVNIHRTPLCGRNWEYFGEDPAHAAKMVVPYIKGLQQNHVAATVKHFVANNSEWNRYRVDSDPDERTLREIYFPAFEAAVKEGGVLAVMSGYNKVRGEWCSHSHYLNNQILKKEWGFKGLVVTDWDGLHSTMKGALGGTDLEMNMGANIRYFKKPLLEAVKNGTIPQAVLDDKVRRLLYVMAKTKFIGTHTDREKGAYETPEHTAIALKVAEDAITLLKNEDDVLPLNPRNN
jgi:beta-glucosidase